MEGAEFKPPVTKAPKLEPKATDVEKDEST
jgi:hypothetical protein